MTTYQDADGRILPFMPAHLSGRLADMPVDEPIEVTLEAIRSDGTRWNRQPYQAWFEVADNGIVHGHLTRLGDSLPQAMSNLQPTLRCPRKAQPGWQIEAVEHVASGLYCVTEVR